MTPLDAEGMFVDQLLTIERIIRSIAQRHALRGDDADDFASWVKLRLLDNDYAIIRKFQGRSSITTYLTVVIANLFRDYRIKEWGRWRPSCAAKRLGPVATRLETLIARDGLSMEEAFTALEHTNVQRTELRRIAAQLPWRDRAIRLDLAALESVRAGERADVQAWSMEPDEERVATEQVLQQSLRQLPAEDQVILRLRYWDGVSIADIARLLQLEQKPLYRRIERALSKLRQVLENEGIDRNQVAEFFAAE